MIRTTWVLFANCTEPKMLNRNTTQDKYKAKQPQTANTYIICNYTQKQNPKCKQPKSTNNELCNMTIQTILQKEEWYKRRGYCLQSENTKIILTRTKHNDEQHFFNNKHHKTVIRQNHKQKTKTNSVYVISHKQPQTQSTNKQRTFNLKLRARNCAKWHIKHDHKKDMDTNDRVIVCKYKMQTSSSTKGKQRQTTISST